MDAERYRKATELVGLAVPRGASLRDMRGIVAQRETVSLVDAEQKPPDKKPVPDENVFRSKDKDLDKLSPDEIDRRWAWVKQMVLQPKDMAISIDELEENRTHLAANGWYVVLKEKEHWHFRKDVATPQNDASARAQLREEQDAAYAIAQVADYEREQNEGKGEGEVQTDVQLVTAGKPSGAVAVAAAIDECGHSYKRRLVDALAMNHNLSVPAAHQFSHWIFESQEKCTVDEKRRFESFWDGNSGRADTPLESDADANKSTAEVVGTGSKEHEKNLDLGIPDSLRDWTDPDAA